MAGKWITAGEIPCMVGLAASIARGPRLTNTFTVLQRLVLQGFPSNDPTYSSVLESRNKRHLTLVHKVVATGLIAHLHRGGEPG